MADRKNVRLRLFVAALDLYTVPGYDRTTAAEVAALAGVSERTYFRHFPDKREVLFDGEAVLRASLVEAVTDAPDLAPLPVLRHAFVSLVPFFESDRDLQGRLHRVISSAPELRERGAAKLASLTEAVAGALDRRGTPQSMASLAAACGIAALSRARHEWLTGPPHNLKPLLVRAFDDLDILVHADAPDPATSCPRP